MAGFYYLRLPFLAASFNAAAFAALIAVALYARSYARCSAFLSFSACIARLSAAIFAADTCFPGLGSLFGISSCVGELNLAPILLRLSGTLNALLLFLSLVLAETFQALFLTRTCFCAG